MVKPRITALLGSAVLLIVCLSFLVGGVPAYAQTPSAEQMETLRNLPADQQKAVLEAMGGKGGSGGVTKDRQLQFPQTVRSRKVDEEDSEDSLLPNGMPREPRFRADDTLLINLELKQFEDERVRDYSVQQENSRKSADEVQANKNNPMSVNPVMGPNGKLQDSSQRERIERTEEAERRLKDIKDRIQRRNPYVLDKRGVLNIPELGPIPLAGLTVGQATQRIAAESALSEYNVSVMRLPLKRTGTEALKPFGYDLFAGSPTTFAPATDIPVPAEYVVGPGDTFEVQLLGTVKGKYALVVNRDGTINFPELGPISVSGRRFEDVRQDLEARVRKQIIGSQASITIGELRSIQVFVLGDAEAPGAYTVSGLSTITNALFYSGGVKKIGSLRNIQLKREGRTVVTLDLYDLLLNGDTRDDHRLLPGDVIFIPPVGPTVSVSGEVRRPAIYELKGEATVGQVIQLSGGLTALADPSRVTVERVSQHRERVTLDLNLRSQQDLVQTLAGGDVLRVAAVRPVLEDSVTLSGNVYREGQFQFRPGLKLTDILPSVDELKPNADQQYVLIRRESPETHRLSVFSTDLSAALREPSSAANIELRPRDRIFVFDLESGRDRVMDPLMRELQMQAGVEESSREVTVSGRVKVPGKYPLEPGMRITDLIRAGGGLSEAAFTGEAELTRYAIDNGAERNATLTQVDLQRALAGDPAANLPLRAHDVLVIKEVPLWESQEEVDLKGEVRFPGRYPIHRGETLRSVLERAGGLTDYAFADGAVFTRKELRERERKQLETLSNRMQSDLAQLSLQAAQETGKDAGQALTVGQSLLASLRSTKAVGRLVIDLEASRKAEAGSEHDVILKDGDELVVPRTTQEVTVIGEVQSNTSHLFRSGLGRDDYIAMSGGLTPRGDKKHIYVVRADGSIETRSQDRWFSRGSVDIKPGDTIVVPLDTERMRPLPFWTAVTTIIYNLAISAAAVNSF